MILKDISFDTPIDNLLYDDVLLHLADKVNGQEYLRFWMSPQLFIVLGRICKIDEDINLNTVKEDHIPLLRRSSGGGTVIQGPGCLNFAVVLDKRKDKRLDDLKQSYLVILTYIQKALAACGIRSKIMPISDIALLNNNKISGNAQKRGRNFVLHHGTFLCDFDLTVIERYLHVPKLMPEYRKGREHKAFVENCGIDVNELKKAIQRQFDCHNIENTMTDEEQSVLNDFIATRSERMRI